MKRFYLLYLLFLICIPTHTQTTDISTETLSTDWLIVGGGVGGLSALAKLLEFGIPEHDILLVDEKLQGGRIVEKYTSVPGNTTTRAFINFLEYSPFFKEAAGQDIEQLKQLDPDDYEELSVIAGPLQKITELLQTKVRMLKTKVDSLVYENKQWHAFCGSQKILAERVVLATGSKPRSFNYETNVEEIPLDTALDRQQLAHIVKPEDIIIVVGSAHSAILLLKFLTECTTSVKQIINLYLRPLVYATPMGSWTLNGHVGLKGCTAQWAREVLEKNPPENIIRLYNSEENRKQALSQATKIIYAAGYQRNALPITIEGVQYNLEHLKYDDRTGVLGPNLFGIGIAFPEIFIDPLGNIEHRVGVNSFIDYAHRIIPQWISSKSMLETVIETQYDDIIVWDTL